MELVTLYEKCKDGKAWFSLTDICGDWVEIISEHKYVVPEGFHVGEDRTGEPHFYVDNISDLIGRSDYAEVGTDENGFPYLWGMLYNADGSFCSSNKRVYLKRPTSNQD